jgi:formate-dependent nitrite reductase membrane component NrfD
MDPKANGQLQHEWGWLIAIYLFLGGVGAGAYVIAAINGLMAEGLELSTTIGLWISWPALLVGSVCLLADLGSPFKAILAGMKPGSSWIARGTWVISLFMIVAFVHLVLFKYTAAPNPNLIAVLSVVGIVLAVGTMAYTGILLGASKGIPFWRSGAVPVVFTVSALVTGHFSVMIGVALFNQGLATVGPLRTMAAEAAVLVALEVLAILFFLQQAFKHPDARESAERLMRNTLFVIGYFVLGLGVPLVVMLALYYGKTGQSMLCILGVTWIGAVLGLIGGLILRWAVLVCGALPTWNIAGFQFRRIAKPKQPKPEVGLLPPQ